MHAIAHGGCAGYRKRVFTGTWFWEKNLSPHQRLEPASVLLLAFQSDALPTDLFPVPTRHNYSNCVGPKRHRDVVRGHETFIRTACPQNRRSWRRSMKAATDQALVPTLRESLSGTLLQTLPDSVTPLKGHSLSPRSCPPTRSALSERFGYWYDCGSNLAPKHARKHETHPPRVKREFRLSLNNFGFIWAGVRSNMFSYKTNVWYEFFVTNYYSVSTNKKLLVSWPFSGTYGVTKYGNGWRKDVVNQSLEFASSSDLDFGERRGSSLSFSTMLVPWWSTQS